MITLDIRHPLASRELHKYGMRPLSVCYHCGSDCGANGDCLGTPTTVTTGFDPEPPSYTPYDRYITNKVEARKARCIKALDSAPYWFRFSGSIYEAPVDWLESLTGKQKYGV